MKKRIFVYGMTTLAFVITSLPSDVSGMLENERQAQKSEGGVTVRRPLIERADLIEELSEGSIRIKEGVKTIDKGAFHGCGELTSVIIPESVEKIEDGAFEDCINLKEVVIRGENLKEIGARAFAGCRKVKSIECNVECIGNSAFAGCTDLTEVVVNGPKSGKICEFAFFGCYKLAYVHVPGVVEIERYAFADCAKLFCVNFNEESATLDKIDKTAFSGCDGLQSIALRYGNAVKDVLVSAISSNNAVKVIVVCSEQDIKDAHNNLGGYGNKIMFVRQEILTPEEVKARYCKKVPVFRVRNGVKEIAPGAFADLFALCQVFLPDTLHKIGKRAFARCCSLSFVDIPESVEAIGEEAFSGCVGMTQFFWPPNVKKIERQTFAHSGLWFFEMPNSVTEVDDGAFFYCKDLQNVALSTQLVRIGRAAFSGCYCLAALYPSNSKDPNCDLNPVYVFPSTLTRVGRRAFSGLPRKTFFRESKEKTNNRPLEQIADSENGAAPVVYGSILVNHGTMALLGEELVEQILKRLEKFSRKYGYELLVEYGTRDLLGKELIEQILKQLEKFSGKHGHAPVDLNTVLRSPQMSLLLGDEIAAKVSEKYYTPVNLNMVLESPQMSLLLGDEIAAKVSKSYVDGWYNADQVNLEAMASLDDKTIEEESRAKELIEEELEKRELEEEVEEESRAKELMEEEKEKKGQNLKLEEEEEEESRAEELIKEESEKRESEEEEEEESRAKELIKEESEKRESEKEAREESRAKELMEEEKEKGEQNLKLEIEEVEESIAKKQKEREQLELELKKMNEDQQ